MHIIEKQSIYKTYQELWANNLKQSNRTVEKDVERQFTEGES